MAIPEYFEPAYYTVKLISEITGKKLSTIRYTLIKNFGIGVPGKKWRVPRKVAHELFFYPVKKTKKK